MILKYLTLIAPSIIEYQDLLILFPEATGRRKYSHAEGVINLVFNKIEGAIVYERVITEIEALHKSESKVC